MAGSAEQFTTQQYLVLFARRVLDGMADAIEALDHDELHFRPSELSNSIGWEAWHLFRTADNIIHFAFERERPIWLQQGLDEAWGLPRVEQGTGMDPDEAHGLVFPQARLLAIGQTIIAHGNGHLGQVAIGRALLGKAGGGF